MIAVPSILIVAPSGIVKEATEFLTPRRVSAVFSVTTRFQGTYRAACNIHLWRQKDRVVISDIDSPRGTTGEST